MSDKRIIIRNSFWLGLGEIFGKVSMFIVTVLLVRHLSPGEFGELNLANSLAMTFGIMINLGLSVIMTRDLSGNLAEATTYISNILSLKIILGACYLVILIAIASIAKSPFWIVIVLLNGIFFWFDDVNSVFAALFSAEERMEKILVVMLVHDFGVLVAALVTVFSDSGIRTLLAGYIIASCLAAICAYHIARKSGYQWKFVFERSFLGKIVRESLPVFGVVAIGSIYLSADTLIIGYSLGKEAVGYYQGAYKFLFVLQGINVINNAIFPRLSIHMKTGNRQAVHRLSWVVFLFLIFILVPAVGIVHVYANEIILAVYGTKMLPSLDALRLLLWTSVIFFMRGYFSNLLIANQAQKYLFYCMIVGLVVNIGSNLMLIPRWNISGAAWSLIFSEISIVVTSMICLIKSWNRNIVLFSPSKTINP